MVVLVVSRIRQALARSALYSNVVGDSMLARLRNSTIALLGVVTVVGLALVAFIAQLGLPGAFDGAIPKSSHGVAAVGGAIALAPEASIGQRAPARRRPSISVARPPGATPGPGAVPGLGSLNQVGHAPTGGKSPDGHGQPPGVNEPPSPSEQAPTTESTPPSIASPTPESPAQTEKTSPAESKSQGHSRGKAKGREGDKPEAKGEENDESDVPSPGGSKSHGSENHGHHYGAPPKSNHGVAGHGGPGKPAAPESAPPNPSSSPPSPEAGGKETGNSGKSGKSHR